MIDITQLTNVIGNIIYVVLALIALWGLFCVTMVWRRVGTLRFRDENAQSEFLSQVEQLLSQGDFEGAARLCEEDPRAMPQLARLAILNRAMGPAQLRHFVAERFQRDVLSDLEYRLSWVQTVIKAAPMVGLLGTVMGMMGAFGKLATQQPDPKDLADDISIALITTALGLAIAIPLVLSLASINVRIRKMEDLVALGLTRFLDSLRAVLPQGR